MSARRHAVALALGVAASGLVVLGVDLDWQRHEGLAIPTGQPGRGYATIPRLHGTNEGGFHERDIPARPDPSVRRVAVLGDSMTYGTGAAEETYSRRAEEALGAPWQVLNFAQYGYDVAQSAATLRYCVWPYHPDLVVYGAYANDVVRTRMVFAGEPAWPISVGAAREVFPVLLRERSAILRRVEGALLADEVTDTPDYDFYRRGVQDLAAQAAEHDVPLLVYMLVPHVAAGLGRGGCTDVPCQRRLEITRRQEQILDELGIPHASDLPALQASGAMSFYAADGADDEHPSPDGHRVIGDALAGILREFDAGKRSW